MFILIGRFGQNVIGRPASKNNSVVFEVFNFSKLYSDVHSALLLRMKKYFPEMLMKLWIIVFLIKLKSKMGSKEG